VGLALSFFAAFAINAGGPVCPARLMWSRMSTSWMRGANLRAANC
jgi:hypothetical protein